MVFFKPLHLTLCQAATLLHIAGVMAADPAPAQPSGWPARPPINKIDTHHHIVPDFYAQGMFSRNCQRNQLTVFSRN